MARCGCSGSTCSCLVVAGSGVAVSGTGTEANPYVIDVIGSDIAGTITVTDTTTVDMNLTGSGSTADPYVLSATATLPLTGLADITAGDVPAAGDVPVWNGSTWDFAPPPTTPPGAVNVGAGLTGDGSGAAPIRAATSGTWGVSPLDGYGPNTLLGAPVYIDANGQLRAQPRGIDVIATPAMRPDQYPGRVYVRSDTNDTAWSDGTQWQPFAVASPEMIPVPRFRTRLASTMTIPGWNGSTVWLPFTSQYGSPWNRPMGHLENASVGGDPVVRAVVPGLYFVRCEVQWDGGQANGTRKLGLWRNTDLLPFSSDERSASMTVFSGGPSSFGIRTRVEALVWLGAGDYVRVGVRALCGNPTRIPNQGTAYTESGGFADTYLEIYKVGSYTRDVFNP